MDKIINLFEEESQGIENNSVYPESIFEDVIDNLNEKRESDCNKGTFGTLACVCGSYGMAGASMLCGTSAYTVGAGIVKMIIPDIIYPIVGANLWEAVFAPMPTSPNGTLCAGDIDKILNEVENCTAVVIGCGLKVTPDTESIVTEMLLRCSKPIILDADGINCLSKHIDVLKQRTAPTILTPHPGEMARLCDCSISDIQDNREQIALEFAEEFGCILVLKGVGTVVTDGDRISVNPTGNGCLAKGGSGDILAGIIGSFIGQGEDLFESAVAGVYLHGYASNECSDEYSLSCVSARDVIESIKYLM